MEFLEANAILDIINL